MAGGPHGDDQVSARYYLERIVEEHQRAHEQRHIADQEALRLGREAVSMLMGKQGEELRRELQVVRNEFHALANTHITRREWQDWLRELQEERQKGYERLMKVERRAVSETAVDEVKSQLTDARVRFRYALIAGGGAILGVLVNFFRDFNGS